MIRGVALLAVAVVIAPRAVFADQRCETSSFQITAVFGIAFVDGGVFQVTDSLADVALSLADCLCDPHDVAVTIRVTDSSLTPQNPIPLEIWVGESCDDPANRAPGGGCKKLTTKLTSLDFSTGNPNAPLLLLQPVSVRDLLDPTGGWTDPCLPRVSKNGMWVIFNPTKSPAEYCEVTIPVGTIQP